MCGLAKHDGEVEGFGNMKICIIYLYFVVITVINSNQQRKKIWNYWKTTIKQIDVA